MVTLLLASAEDPASLNLYNTILKSTTWEKGVKMPHGFVHEHNLGKTHLLLINDKHHVFADNIDLIHEKEKNIQVDEVLVLSKHVSKSKIPALTIHVIGLPGQKPFGESGLSGGFKGQLVPPSPRFGSLFRLLCETSKDKGIDSEFDITIETTHHGPFLTNKSIILQTEIWVGHILANYSLIFDDLVEGEEISGSWKESIEKSLEATKKSFPGGDIFAHLDRKSFKGWQRNSIISFLNEKNIPVYRGKEIISLHKHKSSINSPSN